MPKITAISAQARNLDRVNVSIDGKYRFSLDIFQLVDLGVKVGRELSEAELAELEQESQFGKLYTRTLEYTMLRPHSAREIRDYLYRKTRDKKIYKKASERDKARGHYEGKVVEITGVSNELTERVFARLVEKNYIDDEKFARWWVENRNQKKGTSRRKLASELAAKGVSREIIDAALDATDRSDDDELQKIIEKKRKKYPDEQKFMAYLARQGFSYDDIKSALEQTGELED